MHLMQPPTRNATVSVYVHSLIQKPFSTEMQNSSTTKSLTLESATGVTLGQFADAVDKVKNKK
jgi:hypothetical protein